MLYAGGYDGFLNRRTADARTVARRTFPQPSGTIIGTGRSERMRTAEGQGSAREAFLRDGVDALVVLGGAGFGRWRARPWRRR